MNIAQLNQHPLNQAASQRLAKEREDGFAQLMHLFTLTHFGLLDADGDPVNPFSPEGKVLMDWTQDVWSQAAALENLEDALDADEPLELPLKDFAAQIIETLLAASRS